MTGTRYLEHDIFPTKTITTEEIAHAMNRDALRILQESPPDAQRKHSDVYIGAAGLALLFLKIYEKDPGYMLGSRTALSVADDYVTAALKIVHRRSNESVAYPEFPQPMTLTGHILDQCGFLHTPVGTHAVAAVVNLHMGNDEAAADQLRHVVQYGKAVHSHHTPSECMVGRAGYLYALKFLIHHLPDPMIQENLPIETTVDATLDAIIEDGRRTAAELKLTNTPLAWVFHDSLYLGAAHGCIGILGTLLATFPDKVKKYELEIRQALDWVLTHRLPDGNISTRAGRHGTTEGSSLVHWCHGAPGASLVACKAYEVFKDVKYLKIAQEMAEITWKYGLLRKGPGLCHGISGNAYVFLTLSRMSEDDSQFQRALRFAQVCTEWEELTKTGKLQVPDKPWSLFEGLAGSVWLLTELAYWDPSLFRGFPCFSDL
ncbi:uncharacterized protein VTP21DRAFT_5050 [Calcarisporiella thermophila]|uniref:uncharacterized protein n=1 Tax=Calcarisporiella thermophila TaxID=911321 RepID=UPI0037441D77